MRRGVQTTPATSPSLIPSTRTRLELEEGDDTPSSSASPAYSPRSTSLSYLHPSTGTLYTSSPLLDPRRELDPEATRARKRQRIDSLSSVTSVEHSLFREDSLTALPSDTNMRLTDADEDSSISASYETVPEAGPSSSVAITNGHNGVSKSNGFSAPYTNGSTKSRLHDTFDGHPPERSRTAISRVSLPGSTLYDDSHVDREEFIRLVIQSLRDVGYMYVYAFSCLLVETSNTIFVNSESAATLEAESGYIMETPEVSEFRQCILDGAWASAEAALMRLGVSEEGTWVSPLS